MYCLLELQILDLVYFSHSLFIFHFIQWKVVEDSEKNDITIICLTILTS